MARASKYPEVKKDVLGAIVEAAVAHRSGPSVRDLATSFEVSPSTMHSFLSKLADEGLVEWNPGRHRSLRPTQAGFVASSSAT